MDKKLRRILALSAVVIIIGLYVASLVFAAMGGSLAVPLTMTCVLIVSYLAVYFHIGKVLADLLKRNRKNREDAEGASGGKDNE